MKRDFRKRDTLKKKDDFKERVLDLRRVTRVMAGGKRFRFRATIVLGDLKGKVGVGIAKGVDVASSIEKARRDAMKNMVTVPLKEDRTVPFAVEAKYGAARVMIKPVNAGHGLIAGGPVRVVLNLAGVKDISAKILSRTTNRLSNAMATIEALKKLK